MIDTRGYARGVHRSLLQRDLLGGLPQSALVLIILLTSVFVLGLEMYFMLLPIVILCFILRALTKRDQWMIDIVFDNILQQDRLLP